MEARFRRLRKMLPGTRMTLLNQPMAAGTGAREGGLSARLGGVVSGLSAQPNLALHGIWLAVTLLLASLSFWAGTHVRGSAPAVVQTPQPATQARAAHPAKIKTVAQVDSDVRYVRRGGSVIRDRPKTSGHVLKKESKGASVRLLSQDDGWARVTDGNITGFMRASVLRPDPPPH
jgi:hypothetical protein